MLDGKTIAITRSKDDATEFIELAQKNNAKPLPLPTIELVSKGEKIVDEFLESILFGVYEFKGSQTVI
jgi:uroporphyrinogen-III synthase